MTAEKLITCVSKYYDDSLSQNMSIFLNAEMIKIPTIEQMFRLIPNREYNTNLLIVDIDELTNYAGDIGLLDIIVTIQTLIDWRRCYKQSDKTLPVGLAVSTETKPRLIKEALSTGFITGLYPRGDDFSIDEKIQALNHMLDRQHHIPQKIQKLLHKKPPRAKINKDTNEIKLTARQQQILNLIVEKGASNKLIARILNISESTVKLHMTQILKKYSLTNRTQLALFTKSKNID
jgi:DNA-binding NarL/FixJ family response regulator